MDVGMLGLIYRGVLARTVVPRVSGHDITLAASIWITGTWFLVEVDCSDGVWLVVVDVDVLRLMLGWVG